LGHTVYKYIYCYYNRGGVVTYLVDDIVWV